MELAALGAGIYLTNALFNSGDAQPKLDKSEHELFSGMLEKPRELDLHEMRVRGAIAPSFGTTTSKLPWDPNAPPYYVAQTAPGGPNESPTERLFNLLANGREHNRQDLAIDFATSRQHYARKRGAAIWDAFNSELHLRDPDGSARSTNHFGFQWLPRAPTDTDWNEAELIAKQLPPNPTLFSPEAYYFTAPGQDFRHGAGLH